MSHLLLISLFILKRIPYRYVCPILPIFIFTSYLYIDHLFRHGARWAKALLLGLSFLVAVDVAATDAQRTKDPARNNRVRSRSLKEFSRWSIGQMDARTELAFFKPRVVVYLVDHRENRLPPRVTDDIRTLGAAQRFFAGEVPWSRLALVRDMHRSPERDIKGLCEGDETIYAAWREKGFIAYLKEASSVGIARERNGP
jgi:hypothetical protein